MTDTLMEYAQLWKRHGVATESGDYQAGNRAMKQLIKFYKIFEKDPETIIDAFAKLLQNNDSWIASGVATHCLALRIHVQESLAVLHRVARNEHGMSSLSAAMILKQWHEQGCVFIYKGQKREI